MRAGQLLTPKRFTGPVFASSYLRSSVLLPRTFATTSAFSSSRPRIYLLKQQSTRIQVQNVSLVRSYWWSSKPSTPADASSASDADVVGALSSIQEGSTLTHPSTELGGQPEPSASHAGQVSSTSSTSSLQDSAALSSNSTSDLSSSLPTSELSSTIPTNDALGSLEALQAATTEFSALASLDYSHLFSWVWPSGFFLRIFHLFQELPVLYTSPIVCMVLGVLFMRVPLSYFQFKGLRASAAWAPHQEEFKALSQEYKTATAMGDNIRALEAGQRLMKIRQQANSSPFAPLVPALALAYVGIGSFLGMGRLAAYQKEVVAMGGTGPLANPEGFLGTGWLTDLTTFDPILCVLLTALTWINARRSALDVPKFSVWMTRMPHLITPVFAVVSLLVRFSAAQMIVAAAAIGYNVAQSYALRVPPFRRMVGMEGVKNQDSKTFKFAGFQESWKEAFQYMKNWGEESARKGMPTPMPTQTRSGTLIPAPHINRSQLKIKDAPSQSPKLLATPDAPPPPPGMFSTKKDAGSSIVLAGSPPRQSTVRGSVQSNPPAMKIPPFKLPPALQKHKGKAKGKVVAKKGK